MVEILRQKALNALFPKDTHPELPLDPDAERPGQYKFPLHFTPGLQLLVFVGGCFGTLTRYEVASSVPAAVGRIPYGTLLINLSGAFALGMLLEGLARRGEDRGKRQLVRLGLGTGFMGAYTTYSTLAVEAGGLLRANHFGVAMTYGAISVVGGIVCSACGIQLAAVYHHRRSEA